MSWMFRTQGATGAPSTLTMAINGEEETVETTVLRVGGATGWLGATLNGARARTARLTNLGVTSAYIAYVAVGASVAGTVSSSAYEAVILAGASLDVFIPSGYDLSIVRASGSASVRFTELI